MKYIYYVRNVTAHNRTVYASPPVGGSGYGFARSVASLVPTQNLRHSLPALQAQKRGKNGFYVFALAYSGCQTVVNSQNVM
jgi:hypothetical protein